MTKATKHDTELHCTYILSLVTVRGLKEQDTRIPNPKIALLYWKYRIVSYQVLLIHAIRRVIISISRKGRKTHFLLKSLKQRRSLFWCMVGVVSEWTSAARNT